MTTTDGTKDILHRDQRMFLVDERPLRPYANGPVSDQWGPTIITARNGSGQRIYQCLVCGATHSKSNSHTPAHHTRRWWAEHKHGCFEPGRES